MSRSPIAVLAEKPIPMILQSPEFTQKLTVEAQERHRTAYQKLCELLTSGVHTNGLDIKHLSRTLFRLKLGYEERILAVLHHDEEGRSYWLMMDLLLKHDYKNKIARFDFSRASRLLDDFFQSSDATLENEGGGGGGGAARY
jgi:hypothetical protein